MKDLAIKKILFGAIVFTELEVTRLTPCSRQMVSCSSSSSGGCDNVGDISDPIRLNKL